MKIREYIQVKPIGTVADPTVLCPANGYVLDVLTPANSWVLIAQFSNNSPFSTTFDPKLTVSSSNKYAWNLGDGSVLINYSELIYTYLSTLTRLVKLYAKSTNSLWITQINFSSDNIVGILDLSNTAFNRISAFILNLNSLLTSVIFTATITANTTYTIDLGDCNITGVLDLSMFTSFYNGTGCTINIINNANLTNVLFSTTPITAPFSILNFSNCNITGVFDLSMLGVMGSSANISIANNSNLTGVIFASTITNAVTTIEIYFTGIIGTLDVSMFIAWSSVGTLWIFGNSSMTNITFPSSTISGFIKLLNLSMNSSLGYIDLTKLKTGVNGLNWNLSMNSWSAAIVNRILFNIDTISIGGFTGRIIDISANTAPDTTSGGYNGSAAVSSLTSKGFIITTD
jgi:hypothetical protein